MLLQQAAAQPKAAMKQQSPFIFRHLDQSNGLLSNQVFALAQDKKGFIWIGTTRGLQRYDGQRFTNYSDTGVAMNGPLSVSTIYPDEANSRLIYMKSLKVMKQRKLLSQEVAWLQPEKEWREAFAFAYTDQKQKRWQLQYYHPSALQDSGSAMEGLALIKDPGRSNPYFGFFVNDKKNHRTWVTDFNHGLLVFDEQYKKLFEYGDRASHEPLMAITNRDPLFIAKIKMDDHANLWVLTWSDIFYRYNTNDGSLHQYSVAAAAGINSKASAATFATAVLPDDHGNCWIATAYAGLLQYHYENDSFTAITSQPGNDLSVQYNHEIYGLLQDREHNIWVGSDRGVSIFNPYQQYFSALAIPAYAQNDVEVTCALQTSDSGLIVGSHGDGIHRYDKHLNHIDSHRFAGNDENLIWSMLEDREGNVFAGCQHGYVHQLDKKFKVVKTMHPSALENATVRVVQQDNSGNIYFGLNNGKIAMWNRRIASFTPFADKLLPTGFTLSPIHAIYFDEQGICYAGTENGVAIFDTKTNCFTALYKPALHMQAIVQSIVRYNDSTLLTGFQNAGIYFFSAKQRRFTQIAINTGQPFWSANTLGLDINHNTWFTTDYALFRYNASTKALISFLPVGGLAGASFIPGNFIQAAPDKWITCTNTAVIRFNPSYLVEWQKAASAVFITGINAMDKPLFADSLLAEGKPIELSYKNNFINIEFSNLQFSGALDTKYYYRLTGIDKDWVTANGANAGYTNLPPGRYHFTVTTGSTANTKDSASFEIAITPPYWETTWFRLLCAFALLFLMLFIATWYVHNIRREAAMKEQVINTEMMALRAQMNPHFIFNCINSIDALIQCDDKYNATMYLNKFAKLIRNILDSSKQQTIGLRKDLETLQLYLELERLRNSNKFTAKIKTEETVFNNDCKVPPLIIQPYVENAILHGLRNKPGNNGKLTIDIYREQDRLVYIIEDNGIGRKAAENTSRKYRSYGMEMSRDRLKLFNQQEDIPVVITDLETDGAPTGTRVQVSLKIK